MAHATAAAAPVRSAITVADATDPEFPLVEVSRSFEELTGYPSEEILGRNCRFLQGPHTSPEAVASIREALREGRECSARILNYRKDATAFWNDLTIVPVHDSEGRLVQFVGNQSDATPLVKAATLAAETQAHHAAVLGAVSEGLVVQDPRGRIVGANEAAERILGVTSDQLRGLTSIDRDPYCIRADGSPFPGDEHPAMITLRTGQQLDDVPMGIYHPDGTLRWITISSRLIELEADGPVAVVTAFTDVTDKLLASAEQSAVRELAAAVADGVPSEQLFSLAGRLAAELFRADGGGVVRMLDPDRARVVGSWARGDAPVIALHSDITLAVDSPLRALTGANPVPVVREHGADEENHTARLGYRSSAIAPITLHGRGWGALGVFTRRRGDLVGAEGSLARLADLVGLALANADQREMLSSRESTDSLTGLANQRAFHVRLREAATDSSVTGVPVSVAMLDVDGLKEVNHHWGHEVGDLVLSDIAARLREELGDRGFLARVGGDEFAVISRRDSAQAAGLAASLCRSVSGETVVADVSVRLTAGVCDLDTAGDRQRILRLADAALYWCKSTGAGGVQVFDPTVVQELSPKERSDRLRRSQSLVGIRALARAIDAKDPQTHQHSERVAALARRLATAMDWSEADRSRLELAALVHDVGKIGVRDAVLLKPSGLTREEYEEIKRHPAIGAEIVADVLDEDQVEWVRHHHERPDGTGYPDGLRGEEISLGAAIIALADSIDVMTSERTYSPAKSWVTALEECRALVGKQFTDEVVTVLEQVIGPRVHGARA